MTEIWQSVERHWEWWAGFVAFLASALGAWFLYIYYFRPAMTLLWRHCSRYEQMPLLAWARACGECFWPMNVRSFSNQVRLWIELRILDPEPEPDWRWEAADRRRRYQRVRDRAQLAKDKSDYAHDIRRTFGRLKLLDERPVIDVKTVFDLTSGAINERILEYLSDLEESDLLTDGNPKFYCSVRIEIGFLLPLDLIAGLLPHFAEDWKPLIGAYQDHVESVFSVEQWERFMLWLLWGPSVPLCSCPQWTGPTALQYGYGDENNSISVFVRDDDRADLIERLQKSTLGNIMQAYPSLACGIQGRPFLPISLPERGMCSAQQNQLDPNCREFLLEFETYDSRGHGRASSVFYSAYVWAMFVVWRDAPPTSEAVRSAPWRHALPIFQHANVVDGATYSMAKDQLARGVLGFLRADHERARAEGLNPAHLVFTCALDETGCGCALQVPVAGETISQRIEARLSSFEYRDLRQFIQLGPSPYADRLSSCHLTEMLSDMFKNLFKVKQPLEQEAEMA